MSEATVAVQVEEISSVKKKLLFDISWMDVKNELDEVYRDVGKNAKIKGFRQGKVPRKILETTYKEHVEGETITNLVNKYYWDALKEKGIIAVTQPDIDQNGIEDNKSFIFTATVEVEPAIDPKDYEGLILEKEEKQVTESDIESRLQEIRNMFGTMEEVSEDRDIKGGDFAVIDFEGTLDGESLKEMTADNYLLEIGSSMFVPGFEDQIIGLRKGQTKQIEVKFPEEYRIKRIAGKNVVFSVTVKNIKERKLPEIDENFIRNFEKYETLEDLKLDIKKNLEEENKANSETALKVLIVTKLLEKNEFDAPPSYVERQIYYMLVDTRKRMASRGMNTGEIDELSAKYREMYREEATRIVKSVLLMKHIAAKESITVDSGEIEEKIKEMALRRGQNFDEFKKSLEEKDMVDNLTNEILTKKVFEFIEEKSTMNVVNIE
ncbi:MAG: trigger factor [Deltaproteobacteria bacterium]|nr:trigger factor [Deltaproteobacteria bacterium]